ncbi:hypothetical protein EVAR_73223_1 [Eumeta japonica]|uniref:Uncharacterized protein n=1 Tax=Eumeta variegata TaxID=151549 RepID=A0A4C1T5R2_EUMVA|nr:hypothetical protein EVAR_73223_1 [Eumeta japonica]
MPRPSHAVQRPTVAHFPSMPDSSHPSAHSLHHQPPSPSIAYTYHDAGSVLVTPLGFTNVHGRRVPVEGGGMRTSSVYLLHCTERHLRKKP